MVADRAPTLIASCKDASLHDIGDVQSHGALIAINAETHRVEYCSANANALLGIPGSELLGQTGQQWLSCGWPALAAIAGAEGRLQWTAFEGPEQLNAIGHRRGAHLILEFEKAEVAPSHHWWNHAERTRFLEQLSAVRTPEQCHQFLVTWIFEHSGYDRVMLYRFLPSWDGEVAAERCRTGLDGFLGLRFPAADIPANARQLFTLNRQRAIVDVDPAPWPILAQSEGARPLDLTYSTLRAAHPVHIEYLKNMGVQASLTLSIVIGGKLWGLVACHHLSRKALPIEDRLAFEEIAMTVSLHMSNVLGLSEHDVRSGMREQLSGLQGAMSATGDDGRLALSLNLGAIRQTFRAGGAWLRFEGEDYFAGRTPDRLSLTPLRDFLESFPREQVSYYDALPEALRSFRPLSANASGVLYLPLGGADFLALLRPEVIETVSWAGKVEVDGKPLEQLTPRRSFAVWSQRMRNAAEPWTDIDHEFAVKLRTDLLAFIANARLERIALHDPLTGLANRLLFEKRLQQEVRNSITQDSAFAVLMVDLDRFKKVNDTFGHATGDQLLTEVAARLLKVVRTGDTVARLGGDEFAILQTSLESRASAVAVADTIIRTISLPYELAGHTAEIGASVGVSMCPFDTVEQSELLECADLALYQVKRSGKNAYSMYAPGMRESEPAQVNGDLLSRAIPNQEFHMVYQPIVDARSGELRGLESFLRWRPEGGEVLSARQILPLLEQKHLMPAVSQWVMDSVFRQYHDWMQQGLPLVPVTINISAVEFATQDLRTHIEALGRLYETGLHWLRLDIKEEALLADVGAAIRKLGALRDAGVSANLDNFGRGIVPLGQLTQLPFRGIKLEGMLFDQKRDRAHFSALFNIVQSIAQAFNGQLTVTRIDTAAMRDSLKRQRVDFLQGDAICRPAEAEEAAEWLRDPHRFSNRADPSF